MNSSTKDIVKALRTILQESDLYRLVDSSLEEEPPEVLNHPAASVFFAGDTDQAGEDRPKPEIELGVFIFYRDLRTADEAAGSIYDLLDKTRDAINGKRGGLIDIEPFRVVSRELEDIKDGEIIYLMRVRTRQYLPVPEME